MPESSSSQNPTTTEKAGGHKRWYDHDPTLLEVLDLLRSFQGEVRAQAEIFLTKIEEQVGSEHLARLYEASKPPHFGNRWYDADPVISKAVELLRVVPPESQKKAAQKFLEAMKKQGISPDLLKQELN